MAVASQPQWIARMYAPKTGRDHLGLGSVSSDQILPALVPGINVLTIHPRYHSFYTFLLDEYWRRDIPRSARTWERFFRPREFVFSLGNYLCDHPEHGETHDVVGGQATGPLSRDRGPFDTSFHYIERDLGGYGLYYRSVIMELGLIIPGGQGFPLPVDVPDDKGKQMAEAFRQAVKNTRYYRDYFGSDHTTVPKEVILDYIRAACLCQLQPSTAPDRAQVRDVYFHGGAAKSAVARRNTLRLFLDIADQTNGHPVDQDTFRQLLYFGTAANGARYQPVDPVGLWYRKWRLYQTREYYSFALNAFFWHLCDWGVAKNGDLKPLPMAKLWQHIDEVLDFGELAAALGVPDPHLGPDSDVLNLFDWLEGMVGARTPQFDTHASRYIPVHEHRLYELARDRRAPVLMNAGMLTLLAMIYLRFEDRDLHMRDEWQIARMGSDGRLSVDSFIASLRRRSEAGQLTLRDTMRWLYGEYVILQHQIVANGKLPDNTYRFQREGDRLRFFLLDNRLSFMDSRFNAISTTVHELGLCGKLTLSTHSLTDDGKRFLADGDLP
jgi:hypothetical protein